ncbi:MutS-related protein [Spelaeicoccus albus]|uniref:DNA mismatch repair ATPase MutS n=1 Tax=Spelaeicoccus albus TaxID=1280376 RepID=A0A7Z0IIW0_9MICO|nr:DNA mismatch repair protein MutS [Spelaeicoccus albus]NYI68869.1 DNA mismatch repair ATPase MutS [Spelaeicoccus albus]
MKAHLMYADADFDVSTNLPGHYDDLDRDLELGTLLTAMAGGDDYVYDISHRALMLGLHRADQVQFRQEVLQDCLRDPEAIRELYALAGEAIHRERRIYGGLTRGFPDAVLRHAIEVMRLFDEMLTRVRDVAAEHAGSFTSTGMTTLCQSLRTELDDEYLDSIREHLSQLKFDHGIQMSAELGRGNKAAGYVLRLPNDAHLPWWKRMFERDRTGFSFRIADRDESGAQALAELRGRGVNLAANSLAQSTDHILSFFTMLKTELAFYVGGLNLHDALANAGADVCFPEVAAGDTDLDASGLYDPSLRLTSSDHVVGNDIEANAKRLIVITGANRGGKSTLLRSVGVAQLMFQAGLYVPARKFRASLCDGVFTHFKREEDAGMVSGKLDEEMARMSDIVDRLTPSGMLLCNESFSATNEREGSEIARQIVTALLEAGVRVLYVTHMFDLARSLEFDNSDDGLFLRAERLDDGGRTFRVRPGKPLPTSFGEDLFNSIFGAGSTPNSGRSAAVTIDKVQVDHADG